jgi:hypothetical protein
MLSCTPLHALLLAWSACSVRHTCLQEWIVNNRFQHRGDSSRHHVATCACWSRLPQSAHHRKRPGLNDNTTLCTAQDIPGPVPLRGFVGKQM